MTRKLQTAQAEPIEYSMSRASVPVSRNNLIYSAVAAGVVLGAAASAYWWKSRARALQLLQETPFERVEELIASCENKIEDIERTIEELKQTKS